MEDNEFNVGEVPPGSALLVEASGESIAVFNVGGVFYATQAECTHQRGPLDEGELDGTTIECPWHGSKFDVLTGKVLRGPAKEPLKTYRVSVEGQIGRVEI